VHRDHGRRVGAQIRRGPVQLLERLGRQHPPFGADQRLKLRGDARVAAVRAGARVDQDRDGGQSLPPASSLGASSVSSDPPSSPSAAATSAILGYQFSNTSTIWRACFSFEMLNDDCLR
jgi:hypothetical protein